MAVVEVFQRASFCAFKIVRRGFPAHKRRGILA